MALRQRAGWRAGDNRFNRGAAKWVGRRFVHLQQHSQSVNCTVSENRADQGGRGVFQFIKGVNVAAAIVNTIIGQKDAQVSDLETDQRNGGSLNLISFNNLINIDPRLGALQDNGGRSQTMALLPDSQAIGAGAAGILTPPTDQRGALRDVLGGTQVDIGAYESRPVVNVAVNSSSNSTLSDNLLTLPEAIALATGSLSRVLSAGERAQVTRVDGAVSTITFADSLKGTTFQFSTASDNRVGPSAFAITRPVVIQGPSGNSGVTLAVAPGTSMRLFDVTATGNLTLQNLTLTGGTAPDRPRRLLFWRSGRRQCRAGRSDLQPGTANYPEQHVVGQYRPGRRRRLL